MQDTIITKLEVHPKILLDMELTLYQQQQVLMSLKVIDDAIRDGVDIISIAIGLSSLFQTDFLDDPIAIRAFHAEQMGVMVVCSVGNNGPDPYIVVNTTASNIDRNFQ